MGFIYKITNTISNKCYIGETKKSNPYLRWNEHTRKITQGIGCPALQDAVKKYGVLPLHRRSFAPIKSLVAL
jgi:hypothetical protein